MERLAMQRIQRKNVTLQRCHKELRKDTETEPVANHLYGGGIIDVYALEEILSKKLTRRDKNKTLLIKLSIGEHPNTLSEFVKGLEEAEQTHLALILVKEGQKR